jgi:type IV secretory pathway VirB9-like protein
MYKFASYLSLCCLIAASAVSAQEGLSATETGFLSAAEKAALLAEAGGAGETAAQSDEPVERAQTLGGETEETSAADPLASSTAIALETETGSTDGTATGAEVGATDSESPPPNVETASQEGVDEDGYGLVGATAMIRSKSEPMDDAEAAQSGAIGLNQPPAALPRPLPGQYLATGQSEKMRDAANVVSHREGRVRAGAGVRLEVVYGQGYPVVVCKFELICLIELEEGEEMLDAPLLSDPTRWNIGVRITDGEELRTYLALQPWHDAQEASLSLFTNRRSYYILLHPDAALHTPVLAFHYPDSEQRKIEERMTEVKAARARKAADKKAAAQVAVKKRAAKVAKSGVSTSSGAVPADELDFDFRLVGRAGFKPVRVYTDGKRTYVDLPASYRGELPTLLVTSGNANNTVNIAVKKDGRQLVADKSLEAFTLVAGNSKVHVKKGR